MAATENWITLPADLLTDARCYAEQENRGVAALIEEAVRLYMEVDPAHNAFFRSNREAAKAQGASPEERAQELVDESRAQWRRSA